MELHFLTQSIWRRFDYDGDGLREVGLPVPERTSGATEIGEADGLFFSLAGDGPSYDLLVRDLSGHSLLITDTHLTRTSFCHLPALDAVLFVDGDRGTSTSRAFPVVALADIRERLSEGGSVDIRSLNHFRLQAAVNGIDPDGPNLRFCAVEGSPEFVIYWNTPMANPARAGVVVVEWFQYTAGDPLRPATRRVSKPMDLENFWVHDVLAGRRSNGELLLTAVGIGRKRRDFVLELRVATASGGGGSLREVMRSPAAVHRLNAVPLRHNASVLALASVDDGLLGVFEAPNRSTRLLHVTYDATQLRIRELEPPCPIEAIRSFAEPQPDPEPEVVEVADDGFVTVTSDGVALDAGVYPADARLTARVVVVGDGAGADLRWWLAQSAGQGEVGYTLHVTASRAVQIRYDLDDLG